MARHSVTRDSDELTKAFMARLSADPVRAAVRADFERAAQKRIAEERAAAEPILEDLKAAGHPVNSIWDLVNTSTPYPKALPVLMKHLERGDYPAPVLEVVARALAVKPAIAYWDRLVACYRSTVVVEAREGIAVALAASVTTGRISDLMTLTEERQNGDDNALFFLKPIVRLGGAAGRDFVDALTEDPVLGKEGTALMKRARKSTKS